MPRHRTGEAARLRYFTFTWSPDQRLRWLKATIAFALIAGFCLSWKLWLSSRLFPLAPVADWLPKIPFPIDRLWFCTLLALLPAIAMLRSARKLIVIFVLLAGLLSLWDQTRWQPWFYLYLVMLAVLGLQQRPAEKSQPAALNTCRAIVIFTYFWSGVQKFNANFVRETWPDIAGPLVRLLPHSFGRLPSFLALAVPAVEVVIALGLITRRFRDAAAVLAIASHILILILLVRSGENTVVWPWNVAMILFVIILFWRDNATRPREILAVRSGLHALAVLLFGVLPALSFFDCWDSYLSSALYSGNTDQGVIYVSPAVIDRLPAALQPHIWTRSQPFFLDINRWSYGELNVPLYPEPRVYKAVTKKVCEFAGDSQDVRLRIKEEPDPLTARRNSEYYDCDHL